MAGRLYETKGATLRKGCCASIASVGDNYASHVILPLSIFILALLYESPWGVLSLPLISNTPGDNRELGNLDSTFDSASASGEATRKSMHPLWLQFPPLYNERVGLECPWSCRPPPSH